uniref:PRKCSH domain-containing protein n=1 Tax=Steinernema glaseri TaxID=37863 RepID=A0A1I7ZWV9_9BILA
MDSVPFSFCMDVMGNIQTYQYKELSNVLSGRWKAAAGRYDDNVHDVRLSIYCEDGEWGYATYMCGQEISYEDLLPLDRRYVRCDNIYVSSEPDSCDFPFKCSKEKLFNQVIPFFIQRSSPYSGIVFHEFFGDIPMEHAHVYLNSLRSYIDRGLRKTHLDLQYYGQESEDFVAAWVDSDRSDRDLCLDSSWPHTQAVEDLVLKYLRPRNRTDFFINTSRRESEECLKMNTTLLKATLDTWSKLNKKCFFRVGGRWTEDMETLLSVPLPPNVTRAEPKADEENVIFWTREDGSTLNCWISWEEPHRYINICWSDEQIL